MKKLSKAQQRVMNESWQRIDKIKSFDSLEDWFGATNNCNAGYNTAEKYRAKDNERFERLYGEQYREGLNDTLVIHENRRTIEKLVELGYMEIVDDDVFDYETVKLLKR